MNLMESLTISSSHLSSPDDKNIRRTKRSRFVILLTNRSSSGNSGLFCESDATALARSRLLLRLILWTQCVALPGPL